MRKLVRLSALTAPSFRGKSLCISAERRKVELHSATTQQFSYYISIAFSCANTQLRPSARLALSGIYSRNLLYRTDWSNGRDCIHIFERQKVTPSFSHHDSTCKSSGCLFVLRCSASCPAAQTPTAAYSLPARCHAHPGQPVARSPPPFASLVDRTSTLQPAPGCRPVRARIPSDRLFLCRFYDPGVRLRHRPPASTTPSVETTATAVSGQTVVKACVYSIPHK